MEPLISAFTGKTARTASMEDTVEKVEGDLNLHRLNAIPVVDPNGSAFGIISAADLLHFHASKRNPKAVRAWELCTYRPISVSPATPTREVARMMVTHKIQQILITEGTVLKGIVSTFDLLEHYLEADAGAGQPAAAFALA